MPVRLFRNWTRLSLMTGKCLMGGLKRMDITNGHKNEIQNQIYDSFKTLRGLHQILTPAALSVIRWMTKCSRM